VNGSRLTQSQSRDFVPVVQGNERDGHGGLEKGWKPAVRQRFPALRSSRSMIAGSGSWGSLRGIGTGWLSP